jgi:hypothetical protein
MRKTLTILFALQFFALQAGAQALYFTPYPFYWGAQGILAAENEREGMDIAAGLSITNTLRYNINQIFEDTLLVDYDATVANLRLRSPSFSWGQLSLSGVAAVSYEGFLDGFLEAFHGVFNMPNQGRELFEQNLNRLYYLKDGTVFIDQDGENVFRPELQLYYHSPWLITGPWGLQGMAGWRLGEDGPLPFDGAQAYGLGMGLSWQWEQLYTSLTLGAWYRTPPDDPWGIFYLPFSGQGEWHIHYQVFPWLRAFAQLVYTTAPYHVDNYWLSGGSGFFTLGADFPLGERWEIGISLWEEFLTWATMELALQATLRWKW